MMPIFNKYEATYETTGLFVVSEVHALQNNLV